MSEPTTESAPPAPVQTGKTVARRRRPVSTRPRANAAVVDAERALEAASERLAERVVASLPKPPEPPQPLPPAPAPKADDASFNPWWLVGAAVAAVGVYFVYTKLVSDNQRVVNGVLVDVNGRIEAVGNDVSSIRQRLDDAERERQQRIERTVAQTDEMVATARAERPRPSADPSVTLQGNGDVVVRGYTFGIE